MRNYLLILLLPFLLVSCNQNTLGAGFAVKNFFTTPLSKVKNFFTKSAYEEEKEKTERANKNKDGKEIRYCVDDKGRSISSETRSDFEEILKHTTEMVCECDSWGSCSKDLCSCEKLCPDNFNIFKRPPYENTEFMTTPQHSLFFRNRDDVGNIDSTKGYCWGHARVNAQFNRLAFFEPGNAPHDIASPNEDEQRKAIAYYKGLIDQITSNKTVTIPGFQSLNEFSEHPAIQSYLGDKVAKSWAKHAMSWQGLAVGMGTEKKSKSYYQSALSGIKEKLDLGVQPTILFTTKGEKFETHAVLASHIKKDDDGRDKYCLRDSNKEVMLNADCKNYLKLNDKGELTYTRSEYTEVLGDIQMAHNEESDMVAQAQALKERCRKDKDCGK